MGSEWTPLAITDNEGRGVSFPSIYWDYRRRLHVCAIFADLARHLIDNLRVPRCTAWRNAAKQESVDRGVSDLFVDSLRDRSHGLCRCATIVAGTAYRSVVS